MPRQVQTVLCGRSQWLGLQGQAYARPDLKGAVCRVGIVCRVTDYRDASSIAHRRDHMETRPHGNLEFGSRGQTKVNRLQIDLPLKR